MPFQRGPQCKGEWKPRAKHFSMTRNARNDRAYQDYHWIAVNPQVFGGKPIIRGTRFSVAFILGCLAEEMTAEEIEKTYGTFPKECLREVLHFAEELADKPLSSSHVVA